VPAGTTTEASADTESGPAARLEQDRVDSTHTDDARIARTEAQATEEQANVPADTDDRSAQEAAN
jgi:hypothetical protein